MSRPEKDSWEKAAVILQPVGGLLTALSVAILGIVGSRLLSQQQAADTSFRSRQQSAEINTRLYTELMSSREQADSNLRKDMFGSIIDTFLKGRSMGLEQDVLNLELLAYNFHESLDLGPLFKHVFRRIDRGEVAAENTQELLKRLERVALEITSKQVGVLEEAGAKWYDNVGFEDLANHREGVGLMDRMLALPTGAEGARDDFRRRFTLEVLEWSTEKKEMRIRLCVWEPEETGGDPEVEALFNLSIFDFPMIDNTRLSHGHRCAVVMSRLSDTSAQITLVYFPGSRAGLKEKPYYDEVLQELRRGRELGQVEFPHAAFPGMATIRGGRMALVSERPRP